MEINALEQIIIFIHLIIIVNWDTKMYLYLISVFYVE